MNLLPLLANFPLCSAFKMLQGKKPLVSNIPSKTQEKRQLFGDLWVSFFCNLKSQTKWKMVTPNENELNDRLDCFSHQWIFIFWHVPFKNVIQLTAGSWSRAPPTFRCIDHALQCHRRPVGWCSDSNSIYECFQIKGNLLQAQENIRLWVWIYVYGLYWIDFWMVALP